MIERYYHALDPGGATGVPCVFDPVTNIINNAISLQETFNISGASNAVVTVQLIEYNNTNNRVNADVLGIFINGAKKELNDTFQVTLDPFGLSQITAKIMGDPSVTGSIVYGKFAIVAVSTGFIGVRSTQVISKSF